MVLFKSSFKVALVNTLKQLSAPIWICWLVKSRAMGEPRSNKGHYSLPDGWSSYQVFTRATDGMDWIVMLVITLLVRKM